jgi:undecaprenyl-diphosphatase
MTSSFPSGHATSAFCAATLLADGDPHLAPLYYGAATVVALSRIHVKIHHASDVVGGVAIGVFLGQIGKRIAPLERAAGMHPAPGGLAHT